MRSDQTQIIKEFNRMHECIHLLEVSLDEQQIEIDQKNEDIKDLEQELLIQRIELHRYWTGQDRLTV